MPPIPKHSKLDRRNLDRDQTINALGKLQGLLARDEATILTSGMTSVPDLDDDSRQQYTLFVAWMEDR
jgi:hypothetical protein